MRYTSQYCRIRYCFYFESPLERSLPILFVLEPEAVSVSHAFKLVQDYGRENWTWTIERLQQSSGEELQFCDVSVIQFCNIMEQLLEQSTRHTWIHRITVKRFYAVHIGPFCWFYLWVCAAELRIYVFKRLDRRQIQSFSDFSVTSEAEVSSSLDGHGHQICPGEP